ncbi:SurA N-terminal domain-containing protein [bacterium AH-315-P07]|nr:SurA N-terminal domain-containing protein [bacterium AH-315-P07]
MMFFIFIFVGIPLAFMIPGSGGGNGPIQGADTPVATVDGIPITSSDFLQDYNGYLNARRQQGAPASAIDLLSDGSVDAILENLIKRTLIKKGAQNNPVIPEVEYLTARLKDDGSFKNLQGEFVPTMYNQWVEGQTARKMNWDAFYDSYAVGVSESMFAKLILASTRVSETEMRETFVRSRRKMKVKYIKVEPEVELSDEDLALHYDDNNENYMTPEERQVQYVAFSVKPPVPEEAAAAVERARAGEAFVDLVEQYSQSADKSSGGDMGWITVTETPTQQQETIFALKEGETSDPVEFFNEIHVYQVVEERINEEDDSMEVHARRIVFRPRLTPEERTAIEETAAAFHEKVSADDFSAIAAADGLSLQTTDMFSSESAEIDTISANDMSRFRQGFALVEKDTLGPEIITASNNLYIGKVIVTLDPRQKTFEEASEDVERDAINLYKNGPEYVTLVNDYVARIKAQAKSLTDVATIIPELNAEIQETSEFGMGDFLFGEGIFWDTRTAFALMGFANPGEIMGPLTDFMRVNNFLELVERTEPDPVLVETEWKDAKELTMERRLFEIQSARQEDYLRFMSEKAQTGGRVMRYDDVIKALIGLNDEQDSDEPDEESTPESNPLFEDDSSDVDATEESEPEEEAVADETENSEN